MKLSFSTLACPSWKLADVIDAAVSLEFDGIELRFIENDDRLWTRPEFSGGGLRETQKRLADSNLKVACLDTSCFFHYPDAAKRTESLEMGRAMIDLAAALGAPAIRIFGDRVQTGADREATLQWIEEGIQQLSDYGLRADVNVWLETHGDFARARDTREVLEGVGSRNIGAVWDPVNAFSEFGEDPLDGFVVLKKHICHIHLKDAKRVSDGADAAWVPVLMGAGVFPAQPLILLLKKAGYDGFVSFEWEKRWHPDIANAELALPHFMRWITTALEAS
jgi:sugar phosphate isomerase/epimerase